MMECLLAADPGLARFLTILYHPSRQDPVSIQPGKQYVQICCGSPEESHLKRVVRQDNGRGLWSNRKAKASMWKNDKFKPTAYRKPDDH